jgi:hypothetical protein
MDIDGAELSARDIELSQSNALVVAASAYPQPNAVIFAFRL